MIYALVGQDTDASYARLSQIQSKFSTYTKINLGKEQTYDDLYQAVYARDLLDDQKLIVCRNYLKDKKINLAKKSKNNFLAQVPKERQIIFWEDDKLPPSAIAFLRPFAQIETFAQNLIFQYLDSLIPHSKQAVNLLLKLRGSSQNLVWNMANRFLILTLIKTGCSKARIEKVTARSIFDWQWSKLTAQARPYSYENLKNLYNGILKIDFMEKTGATNLEPDELISVLLLKYLDL